MTDKMYVIGGPVYNRGSNTWDYIIDPAYGYFMDRDKAVVYCNNLDRNGWGPGHKVIELELRH